MKKQKQLNFKIHTGFTLLEILFVITLIGFLTVLSLIIINPSRQIALTQNSERVSAVNDIYRAVEQYDINNGNYPSELENIVGDVTREICANGVIQTTCQVAGLLYLGELIPLYLVQIPQDSAAITTNGSGYEIRYISTTGQVQVKSRHAAEGRLIQAGADI